MPDKKKDQYPMVRVVWADAERGTGDWEVKGEALKWAREPMMTPELQETGTVGWLVYKGKDHVCIFSTLLGDWLHGLKIPRRFIKEIRYLREE